MLKHAVQREHYANVAVESLSAGTVSRRRFWLIPALLALAAATVLAVVFVGVSTRSSRKATLQLRTEIARLNSGLQPQEEILRRAERARGSAELSTRSDSATRESLKAQSEDLRKKVAASDGADSDSLKQQLLETQSRLALLEKEDKVAETVVRKYGPSVCLLHIVVGFVDKESGQPLQVAVDANGKPQVDDKGMAQLDVGGRGLVCKSMPSARAFSPGRMEPSLPIITSQSLGGTTMRLSSFWTEASLLKSCRTRLTFPERLRLSKRS